MGSSGKQTLNRSRPVMDCKTRFKSIKKIGVEESGLNGADEIGEEAVGGGFDAGVVFDDGQTENIHVEANC